MCIERTGIAAALTFNTVTFTPVSCACISVDLLCHACAEGSYIELETSQEPHIIALPKHFVQVKLETVLLCIAAMLLFLAGKSRNYTWMCLMSCPAQPERLRGNFVHELGTLLWRYGAAYGIMGIEIKVFLI